MPTRKMPQMGRQEPRTIKAEFRAVEGNDNQIELSFSSEFAVNRWFGNEILLHEGGAVSFERLLTVGTVLFTHGRDVNYGKMPVGRIDKAWLDEEQHKGRATITVDEDDESQKVKAKMLSGSIRGVSFGYDVDSWEEVMPGKQSSNGRFTGPAYIALKWEPYEISIEPTPADPSVGVGRNAEEETVPAGGRAEINNPNEEDEENMTRFRTAPKRIPDNGTDSGGGTGAAAVDESAVREQATKAERQRVSDITALCRDFEADPKEYIEKGTTFEDVRAAMLEKAKERFKPTAAGGVRVEKEEDDKIREAASDAILLRGGKTIEKPADGARDFRGMRLRDLAVDCLLRTGKPNAHRLDDESLFREALTPDSQFSGILSNAVNKSMATAYRAALSTYKRWTARGSNPDFKGATVYQISEAGDLQVMTQSGEFEFDEMKDNGVSKAIATFGRSFGMNRQALINDDIGILTKIPDAYVRAADRGINKLVYKTIGSNPAIYDSVTLFHANHGNLAGTAAAIDIDPVGDGRAAMRKQKNLRGNETLNIGPRFLLVPAAKETRAQQFVSVNVTPAQLDKVNPFAGTLEVVADAELDTYSLTAWYLAAAQGDVDTIEVTYLNGDDMPKLESQVGFDFLGIKWRIFIDYGVNVLDFRGMYKNAGL